MRHLLEHEGLTDRVELDSAGTGDWHVGSAPDARATAAARERGIALTGAARQVAPEDFARYDLLVAMDWQNQAALRSVAPDDAARAKVRRLREFDPPSVAGGELDVPDPYFGGEDGFGAVYEIVEAGCRGLLASLRANGAV